MKNIIKNLESLGVVTILTLSTECKATFHFNGQQIGQVEMFNEYGSHDEETLLAGLKTNYEWQGLYYLIPAMVKQIQESNELQVA